MPFTGAHPFAVLPFVAARRRLGLDTTCLAIGAMAPDLEYFARGHMSGGKLGHTWIGLFAWCLPATIAIALVWHLVLKWPLALAAPRAVARRIAPIFARPWPRPASPLRTALGLAASALLGAATHLVWDAFTHVDGFVVRRVPELVAPIAGIPVHRLLQIGCSVVGLAGLALAIARVVARTPPADLPDVPRTTTRLTFAFAIAVIAPLVIARLWVIGATRAGDLMVAPVSGVLAGAIVASLIVARPAARFATTST